MIDLEELLHGNPTWEQVVEFWKSNPEFHETRYLVNAIKKYLRTEEDRQILYQADLSIEELLEGCGPSKVAKDIYSRWNSKLGFEAFRSGW